MKIITVFGTGDNNVDTSGRSHWWQSNSGFMKRVVSHLPDADTLTIEPFNNDRWKGSNLESERLDGGEALAEHLKQSGASIEDGSIHLIAHSHGGNVLDHALRLIHRDSPEFLSKIGSVTNVGVPFLHRAKSLREGSVSWFGKAVLVLFSAFLLILLWLGTLKLSNLSYDYFQYNGDCAFVQKSLDLGLSKRLPDRCPLAEQTRTEIGSAAEKSIDTRLIAERVLQKALADKNDSQFSLLLLFIYIMTVAIYAFSFIKNLRDKQNNFEKLYGTSASQRYYKSIIPTWRHLYTNEYDEAITSLRLSSAVANRDQHPLNLKIGKNAINIPVEIFSWIIALIVLIVLYFPAFVIYTEWIDSIATVVTEDEFRAYRNFLTALAPVYPLLLIPIGFIISSLSKPPMAGFLDDTLWARLRRFALGEDSPKYYRIAGVDVFPMGFEKANWREMPDELAESVLKGTEQDAAKTLRKLREALSLSAKAGIPSKLIELLKENVSYSELVHTGYFRSKEVADLVALGIAERMGPSAFDHALKSISNRRAVEVGHPDGDAVLRMWNHVNGSHSANLKGEDSIHASRRQLE